MLSMPSTFYSTAAGSLRTPNESLGRVSAAENPQAWGNWTVGFPYSRERKSLFDCVDRVGAM